MNHQAPPVIEEVRDARGHRLVRWIAEPRIASVVLAIAHAATLAGGIAAIVVPDDYYESHSLGTVSSDSWGALLTLGGGFGLFGALRGMWWVERAGLWLECVGLLIYQVAIWYVMRDPASLIAFRSCITLALQVCCVSRYMQISGAYLDPRRPRY